MAWFWFWLIGIIYVIGFLGTVFICGMFDDGYSSNDRDKIYLLCAVWPFILLMLVLLLPLMAICIVVMLLEMLCDVVFFLGKTYSSRDDDNDDDKMTCEMLSNENETDR